MKGHFHTPDLGEEFFPGQMNADHLFFGDFAGGWFALDRLMLIRILMTLIVVILFWAAFKNPKLVPSGLQNVGENAVDFVRVHIAEDILGKKEGKRFLPIIASIFFAVLFMNVATVIPGLNVSPNGRIGMPIVLAAVAYIAMIYAGAKRYGLGKFIRSSVVIPNLPPLLHLLVVPIEFFSTFISATGYPCYSSHGELPCWTHIILVLLFSATNFFFWQLNGWTALSGLTVVLGLAMSLFEILVIFLQAYIFALLTAVYIELSLHADSH